MKFSRKEFLIEATRKINQYFSDSTKGLNVLLNGRANQYGQASDAIRIGKYNELLPNKTTILGENEFQIKTDYEGIKFIQIETQTYYKIVYKDGELFADLKNPVKENNFFSFITLEMR